MWSWLEHFIYWWVEACLAPYRRRYEDHYTDSHMRPLWPWILGLVVSVGLLIWALWFR